MNLDALRHSTSHVLASAIKELYPKAKLTIGPSIEDGFYYDFDNLNINEQDLPKIEQKMHEIINKKLDFKKILLPRKKALKLLKNEPYKLELLKDIKGKKVQFYQHGSYLDLCKGGHVKNTSEIKAFKLTKVTKAYWKGDSKNKQLTRIYGTAWFSKDDLKNYLKLLEEAEKRDHRKLGKDLDLFSFQEESPGSPFFHPKGTIVYYELLNLIRELYKKYNYQEIITPLLYDKSLWETSGHWEHFKDDMFLLKIDERDYALKPMNCPSHCLYYKTSLKSYKDLPLRIADFAPLHRNELRGVLGGLTRVRKLQQDDAHIFLTEDQIEKEVYDLLDFVNYIYVKVFNFKISLRLSTRPDKFLGETKLWDKAEATLKKVLDKKKMRYEIAKGEGAFYGPKIDILVKDALNRNWQLATIQLDFQMPQRFDLTYEGKDGKKHTPVMIHRAILGSVERFFALLLEHFSGKLPLWLSPIQVILMTLTEKNIKFANEVKKQLEQNNIRTELDDRNETINKKVYEAQVKKIPYAVTIGDKEQKNKTLAVRTLDGKVKFGIKINNFIKDLVKEIKNHEIK
ncbi:MAG: threonine--tRNA ligase [Nanoarchaeota archaeon]